LLLIGGYHGTGQRGVRVSIVTDGLVAQPVAGWPIPGLCQLGGAAASAAQGAVL
jgi:hypothetical protein